MSILLIDDSASQRLLLSSLLRSGGYTALVQADSAQAAFDHLGLETGGTGTAVDLILLDISMPDLDGITACRRIKDVAGLADIPILMVTASTEVEDLELAFAAGALDFITKPLNKTELLARVRAALKLKHEIDRRKAVEQELAALARQVATPLGS
jgi:DNA-binding response OmpR family regulator